MINRRAVIQGAATMVAVAAFPLTGRARGIAQTGLNPAWPVFHRDRLSDLYDLAGFFGQNFWPEAEMFRLNSANTKGYPRGVKAMIEYNFAPLPIVFKDDLATVVLLGVVDPVKRCQHVGGNMARLHNMLRRGGYMTASLYLDLRVYAIANGVHRNGLEPRDGVEYV